MSHGNFSNTSSFSGFSSFLFPPFVGRPCWWRCVSVLRSNTPLTSPAMFGAIFGLRWFTPSHGVLGGRRHVFRHARNLSTNALAAKVFKIPPGCKSHSHTSFDQTRIAETDLRKGPPPPLRDNFGRMHNYLRISASLLNPCTFHPGVLNKCRPYRTV